MFTGVVGFFCGASLCLFSFCFQVSQERLADVYLESTATHIVHNIENIRDVYNNGR